MDIRVATMNILGTADRWTERAPLLAAQLAELAPDVLCLQEVDIQAGQHALLAGAIGGEVLAFVPEMDGRLANVVIARDGLAPLEPKAQLAELEEGRSAVAVDIGSDDDLVRVVCTHLHWQPDQPDVRLRQVKLLLGWLTNLSPVRAALVCGDLNATPDEPACQELRDSGFASAHAVAKGGEPEWTYPSPATPADAAVRPQSAIDYIWVRGTVEVRRAGTAVDRAAAEGSLYPSDHRAVFAELEIPSGRI